jgi:hypothetical protein
MLRTLPLFIAFGLVGCYEPTGPVTTNTSSDSLPSLEERVEFLQRYVPFRRTYRDLGFQIHYKNNNGGRIPMPAPSDWEIRLVATVPPQEIADWIPSGVTAVPAADTKWLEGVSGAEQAIGIKEWYVLPRSMVGIDRERAVVAYHVVRY